MRIRAFILSLLLLPATVSAAWYEEEQDIMGTLIRVELASDDPLLAQTAIADVMDEMRRIDAAMSPYIPESELSRVNAMADVEPVRISAELFDLIDESIDFSRLTEGAFDITFASAGFLYDYRKHVRPDEVKLAEAVSHIDYHQLNLEPSDSSILFDQSGVKIDLGGIAKGYAVDRCIAILQELGINNALVTAGGDTRVIGQRWGRPWKIGVRDPRHKDRIVAMMPLENVAISTSGDYERFFEEDGERYHHIINPKTGESARELQSVTIIGDEATTTDALSTSVFVLGPERGMALIERLAGIDAIMVDGHGELHYSSGLMHPVAMQNK